MNDADMRLARVSFRKQVSDGNYGTEAAEVTLEWYVAAGAGVEDEQLDVTTMLVDARDLVHGELSRSPSQRVRQSLQPPKNDKPQHPAAAHYARGDDDEEEF